MTKQATLIDHERMIYNITSVYRDADATQYNEGLLWYSDAQRAAYDIAEKYDVPVYIAVAVIAALSPNNKWARNLVNADALIGAIDVQCITTDGQISRYREENEGSERRHVALIRCG